MYKKILLLNKMSIHFPQQPIESTNQSESTLLFQKSSSKSISQCICHDMALPTKNHFAVNSSDPKHVKAAFMTDKLWPSGTVITVGFIGGQLWQWAWVAKLVTESFMEYANLTFTFNFNPSQTNSCNIRIAFDPNEGCYSYIGIDALDGSLTGLNTMNLGWTDAPYNRSFTYNGVSYRTPSGFDQGGYPGLGTTIIHEFGHVCGMIHEHQTPFSNPIVWNSAVVYGTFEGPPNNWTKNMIDTNIIERYSTINMNGSTFDPSSIMKYAFPSSLLLNPSVALATYVEQNNFILSPCDQHWLKQNYPGRNVVTSCVLTIVSPPVSPPPVSPSSNYNSFVIILIVCVLLIIMGVAIYMAKKNELD